MQQKSINHSQYYCNFLFNCVHVVTNRYTLPLAHIIMFSLLAFKGKEGILLLPCGHNRAKQVLHNNININIPQ